MKCLVIGHSGTAGFGLAGSEAAWPDLLERRLNNRSPTWSVASIPLFPVGNRAIDYAVRRTNTERPDFVVLSLNAYPCVIPVVSASVGARFGKRAQRLYDRAERRFSQATNGQDGGHPGVDHLCRQVARRLLGARPLATVAEVARVYSGILQGLARYEGVQVAVLAEAPFSREVRHREPRLLPRIAELKAAIRPIADGHRFEWCDATNWLEDDTQDYWHADCVHLNAAGNARYAEMLDVELSGKLPGSS